MRKGSKVVNHKKKNVSFVVEAKYLVFTREI